MKRNCNAGVLFLFLCILTAVCMILKEETAVIAESGEEQKEQITITWFVAESGYSKTWNPKENVSDAKILKNTGVNLEIASGDLTDLDALIATDSLPDLITVEADATERFLMEDSGMVEPLEPLFAQYAPDVNIPDSMKEWYRNEDGSWYAIASYYYGPERVNEEYGGYLGSHNNNYVRTDLLKQTGVSFEELKTKEGLLKALRAAKELTYQGKDVIPYSGWWTRNIAEQFGMQIEDEEGELLSMYRQPEWLEALQFGNQLYREGLMSPEEFTESVSQRQKKIESGQLFFCTGYSNVKDAKEALYSRDKSAWMDFAGHVRGEEGNTPNLKSVSSGGWTATMIRKDADHIDRIIEFIDYMTGEEATLDAAPAIGAETYDIVDGECVRKDSVIQEFEADYAKAAAKYFLNLEFLVDWTIIQKYQTKSERDVFGQQYQGCVIYNSKASDAAMTIGSESELADTKKQLEEFYSAAEVEILTSDSAEECVQKYEETIAEMEKMGLKELEAYERQAYRLARERLP